MRKYFGYCLSGARVRSHDLTKDLTDTPSLKLKVGTFVSFFLVMVLDQDVVRVCCSGFVYILERNNDGCMGVVVRVWGKGSGGWKQCYGQRKKGKVWDE